MALRVSAFVPTSGLSLSRFLDFLNLDSLTFVLGGLFSLGGLSGRGGLSDSAECESSARDATFDFSGNGSDSD